VEEDDPAGDRPLTAAAGLDGRQLGEGSGPGQPVLARGWTTAPGLRRRRLLVALLHLLRDQFVRFDLSGTRVGVILARGLTGGTNLAKADNYCRSVDNHFPELG